MISKAEFEPRLASLRRRVARLETEAMVLQDAAEQARSLQLVIGKLETFAAPVRDRLEDAGWDTKRELIRTLVQRIEIDGQHIRVVFRVAPGPHGGAALPRIGQHCLGRDRLVTEPPSRCRADAGGIVCQGIVNLAPGRMILRNFARWCMAAPSLCSYLCHVRMPKYSDNGDAELS
ncbi:MAG: hypothetical protein ACJ8AW_12610 [Rhodopila sp.]